MHMECMSAWVHGVWCVHWNRLFIYSGNSTPKSIVLYCIIFVQFPQFFFSKWKKSEFWKKKNKNETEKELLLRYISHYLIWIKIDSFIQLFIHSECGLVVFRFLFYTFCDRRQVFFRDFFEFFSFAFNFNACKEETHYRFCCSHVCN